MTPPQQYQCVFCGETIVPDEFGICSLILTVRWNQGEEDQQSQQCFCHAECFRRLSHKTVPLFVLDND